MKAEETILRRCPYCMELIEDGEKCPSCGHFRLNHKGCFSTVNTVGGRFLIGKLFKQTEDFKYYIGWDNNSNSKVVICSFSGDRFEGITDKNKIAFTKERAVNRFLSYGRNMAAYGFCNIFPRTLDVFSNNGVGYIVTAYTEGESLESILQGDKSIPINEADIILNRLLKGLKILHNYHMIFGCICPENLYISSDGNPFILGIGVPFYDVFCNDIIKRNSLNLSYCAPEVFKAGQKIGSFTDVYSVAAVYYKMVTGVTPPPSIERSMGETLIPIKKIKKEIAKSFSNAVSNALNWQLEKRTKNISSFLFELAADNVTRNISFETALADFLGFIKKTKDEFKCSFKNKK